MKQIIIATLVTLFISTGACNAQSCSELPTSFINYSEAIQAAGSAEFKYTDQLPTGKSSWIVSASYYSCRWLHTVH